MSGGAFEYYHDQPSLAAAVIFAVANFLVLGGHVYQTIRYRVLVACVFSIGIAMEAMGYIGRAVNATEYPSPTLGPYILQSLFLLLPPTLFAAVIYTALGRLVRSADGEFASPVKSTRLTPIFVSGDVFVFLLQASGGGLMSQGGDSLTGQYLVLAGIVLQMVWFGLFVVVALVWHLRMRAACLGNSYRTVASNMAPWQKDLWILYIVSICILVRNVYRTVEYAGGYDGYLMTHEWFLYVFDGLLMLLASVLYTVWPPIRLSKDCLPSKAPTRGIEHLGPADCAEFLRSND